MSYLHTPRICFSGAFSAAGPTRNNLLAALDFPQVILQHPAWDYNPDANGDFQLNNCQVRAASDAEGKIIVDASIDPLIGASVTGIGKMADLDPEHRRVTDLVGMFLNISLPDDGSGDPAPGLSGTLAITQLRDFWSDASDVAVTAWQSVLLAPEWSGNIERSPVLQQLRAVNCSGLSIRLTPIASQPLTGTLIGVIGPWFDGEPKQFVAARRLITPRAAGLYPFPVATCLVDANRKKLVADLSNLPVDPARPLTDRLIGGLVVSILQTAPEGGGVWNTLGPGVDLTVGQWLQRAGIIEWDLDGRALELLDGHRLRFTFHKDADPVVMEEEALGRYVDVDCRSLRMNAGDTKSVDVYARRLGKPLEGQVVNFHLEPQKAIAAVESILDPGAFGYPTDPNRPINSEPREVLLDRPGPLEVTTDRNGHARLTITAKPGPINLPAARKTIDSQLYFLGEPDGWQSWGAIGPSSGPLSSTRIGAACALSVLVFNTHPPLANPTWEQIKPWLSQYALLYPAMMGPTVNLDLSDKDQVDRDAFEIYNRLKCTDLEDTRFMPVSRDLSEFRRSTILAYLRSVITGKPPC